MHVISGLCVPRPPSSKPLTISSAFGRCRDPHWQLGIVIIMPRESGFVSLLSRHTLKQLKFVLPGGAITYWLDTHNRFWSIASSASQGWAR